MEQNAEAMDTQVKQEFQDQNDPDFEEPGPLQKQSLRVNSTKRTLSEVDSPTNLQS